MGKFFHGWRKKFGCVTLLLACVFAMGWVRSLFALDQFPFGTSCSLRSDSGFIAVWILKTIPEEKENEMEIQPSIAEPFVYFSSHAKVSSQVDNDILRLEIRGVAYWVITIPLTFISLWMLLSNPCKPDQKKNTDSITERLL